VFNGRRNQALSLILDGQMALAIVLDIANLSIVSVGSSIQGDTGILLPTAITGNYFLDRMLEFRDKTGLQQRRVVSVFPQWTRSPC